MSRRTVLSAVGASTCAFEAAGRRLPQQASRVFSSTAQQNATHITHFTPTSSAELDSVLSTIREKIFLPSYLPQVQRKKILSSRWAKRLQADPVTIEIDGKVFKFRYMNPFSGEIPNTRKSVFQAIEKFNGASDADFANLRPLLEGIHATGRQMGDNFYAKILRLVGAKGRAYDLVELARSCKKTGLRLDSSEKVNELLHFIQMGAQESGWGRSETEQALRRAEVVVELLENEAHAPLTQIAGDLPLNRDPQVLLAPLHLAAALVVKHGVKDEKTVAKVNKLASTVVKLWPVGKGLKQLHPLQCYVEDNAMGYLLDSNKFVALVSPLLHSLDLASQAVTEPALAAELKSRRDTLEAEVKGHVARAVEKGQNGRGEIVYQKFFGAASA